MKPIRRCEEEPLPVREAQENLRIIRELMERSTRHSTFSGLSGVLAGLVSIAGCLVQALYVRHLPLAARPTGFLLNWTAVIALVLCLDFILTKRRAPLVGKRILSHLGRQMLMASLPGLGTGALLTLFFVRRGLMDEIYPFWMLCYGAAISAVSLFSQSEVARLGLAFLLAGALTLVAELLGAPPSPLGLVMMALSSGGFHIAYGVTAGRREGWQ